MTDIGVILDKFEREVNAHEFTAGIDHYEDKLFSLHANYSIGGYVLYLHGFDLSLDVLFHHSPDFMRFQICAFDAEGEEVPLNLSSSLMSEVLRICIDLVKDAKPDDHKM